MIDQIKNSERCNSILDILSKTDNKNVGGQVYVSLTSHWMNRLQSGIISLFLLEWLHKFWVICGFAYR